MAIIENMLDVMSNTKRLGNMEKYPHFEGFVKCSDDDVGSEKNSDNEKGLMLANSEQQVLNKLRQSITK